MIDAIAVRKLVQDLRHGRDGGPRAARRRRSTSTRGEVLLMMGPSGSGKTTLLSIMGGILRRHQRQRPGRGEEIVGLPESELPRIRRDHIGFIFQGFNLFPALTALENVALFARRPGRSAAATPARRALGARAGRTRRQGEDATRPT